MSRASAEPGPRPHLLGRQAGLRLDPESGHPAQRSGQDRAPRLLCPCQEAEVGPEGGRTAAPSLSQAPGKLSAGCSQCWGAPLSNWGWGGEAAGMGAQLRAALCRRDPWCSKHRLGLPPAPCRRGEQRAQRSSGRAVTPRWEAGSWRARAGPAAGSAVPASCRSHLVSTWLHSAHTNTVSL